MFKTTHFINQNHLFQSFRYIFPVNRLHFATNNINLLFFLVGR